MSPTSTSSSHSSRQTRRQSRSKRKNHRQLSHGVLQSAHHSEGWIVVTRKWHDGKDQDPLEIHGNWPGPVKLVDRNHQRSRTIEQRFEFYLENSYGREGDPDIDKDLTEDHCALLTALVDRASIFGESESYANWLPPESTTLSAWLNAAGHDAVIDENRNLRLTLKRTGFAGQVCVVCEKGCLRFSLPLGRWRDLPSETSTAMRQLVCHANRRTRLVRLVWSSNVDDAAGCPCEAQIDLTGLPWRNQSNRCLQRFWQGMINKAICSLEATVQQLAVELDLLADPHNQQLVRFIS